MGLYYMWWVQGFKGSEVQGSKVEGLNKGWKIKNPASRDERWGFMIHRGVFIIITI